MAEDTSNSPSHSLDLQVLPNSAFHCEKMVFHILTCRTLKYPVSFRSVSIRFVAQNTVSLYIDISVESKTLSL